MSDNKEKPQAARPISERGEINDQALERRRSAIKNASGPDLKLKLEQKKKKAQMEKIGTKPKPKNK
ncbi:MAG: hypothetical protein OEY59_13255 [Deltaproteobacteria bacterium]|nr:hypothetical protein [Deltaproteobacteria bacterium]